MATVPAPLFVLIILSYLALLNSADEGKESQLWKDCHPFVCGTLGELLFPFTESGSSGSQCRGFPIEGCSEKVQKIQFEKGGRWYKVEAISQANSVTISDEALFLSRNCEFFINFTLPSHPYAPYTINPNIFKCNRTLDNIREVEVNHFRCHNYHIYHNDPSNKSEPKLSSQFPNCSPIQLLNTTDFPNSDHLFPSFGKLAVELRLLHPKGNRELKLKLGMGIGLGVPALLLFMIMPIYFIRRYYKQKHGSSNFLKANTSSNPSSNSDLEGGRYFGVPIFSYCELDKATNNFDYERELGDGGFGTVYHGKLPDGREVAIKRLYEHNYRRVKQFMNEVEILTRLRHKNLVTLYGCTSHRSRELLLVYEYVPNGTVADHLHGDRAEPGSLAWPIRMSIAIETASALVYLHASDIIHRDVKTNNILLDSNFSVKVADFGLSRLFPNDVTHVSTAPQGTPGYVDPEYHQCYQLTEKSDVYSFGVVLIELVSSMPAVDISRHRHEINLANLAISKIQKCAFDELIDPNLGYKSDEDIRKMTIAVAELAFRCLQQEKEMRPSMEEVLEELKGIQRGDKKLEEVEEGHAENNDALNSIQPPPSPPPGDEIALLKNIQPPPSPVSVTDKWVSKNTTADSSG